MYNGTYAVSSAIAEGPRDVSCQLKSCQLPRNSAETTCTTSPEQIEVIKLEGYNGTMRNKHALNHDAIELLPLSYRCHKKPIDLEIDRVERTTQLD